MAKKRRIHQVAKELNVSNEELQSFLEKMKFSVSSVMSPVTDEMYEAAQEKFIKVVGDDSDSDFRRKLREKKALAETKREEARQEIHDRLEAATKIAAQLPDARKRAQQRLEEEKERRAAAKLKKQARAEKKARAADHIDDSTVADKPTRKVGGPPAEISDLVSVIHKSKEKQDAPVEPFSRRDQKPPEEAPAAPEGPVAETAGPGEGDVRETPVSTAEETGQTPADKERIKEVEEAERIVKEFAEDRKGKDETVPAEKAEAPSGKRRRRKREKATTKETAKAGRPATSEAKKVDKPKKKRKSKKRKKRTISEEEVQESIRRTLAAMDDSGRPRRRRRKTKDAEEVGEEVDANVLHVTEYASASELANLMDLEAHEVIAKCLEMGMMVTINQRLDMDTIEMIADEFGFIVEQIEEYAFDDLLVAEEEDDKADLGTRPPIVTIMGHVDHGKTSLLDFIRESNIIAGEAGGITQHIGAYEVSIDSNAITFLDTPGHEAFTAMRARGAQITDIVVLVIAADDNVMPQTVEAIDHAKAAGVPIIVAINKVDKPEANPELIRQKLTEHGILVEQYGGKYQSVELSAKTGLNVDKLLELILVEADMLELTANENRLARGAIIESKLDKGKGPVATVLVQNGSLRVGDAFIAGDYSGRVRAMYDERGRRKKLAGPATPVQVVGFESVPQAGDNFFVLDSEKDTREISARRQQIKREQDRRQMRHLTLDEISRRIKEGNLKELGLLLKTDVDGSMEALSDALQRLSNDEVAVQIVHKGVGGISESDVLLASASSAVIIGFNVRVGTEARNLIEKENVDVRLYNVIYDCIEDIKKALEGLLEPEVSEEHLATIEVREVFRVPRIGTVAGAYVVSGKVTRNDLLHLFRNDKLIQDGKVGSLRRFKDDVREVQSGYECGIGIDGYDDVKIGDVIETYRLVETKRTL